MSTSNLEKQIHGLVNAFAFEILNLIQTAKLTELGGLESATPLMEERKERRPELSLEAPPPVSAPKPQIARFVPQKSRAEEKQDMIRDILTYLQVYPDSSCKKIAQHVRKPVKIVWLTLTELRKANKVVSEGRSSNTTYRVASSD